MTAPKRLRLDELLVSRGLAESRAQAKGLIMAGRVFRGSERLDKPGRQYPADTELGLAAAPRFVSRGGEKLAAALDGFSLDLRGAHVLDVGASTGGFTDCALQSGAATVVCVDVGRAQLHGKLRADPRVTNLERLNARRLAPSDLPRAEFGVVVKAVLPGNMDTRIFHKTEQAKDVPDAYDASIKAFSARNVVRSHPRLTADVIYEAVTDNKPGKVRYYSGPDGIAIPRVKQLLGQEWYWQEFRAAVSGNSSPLWQALVPTPVAVDE